MQHPQGTPVTLYALRAMVDTCDGSLRGGLYLFSGGFVDAAGRRVVVVAWSEIRSIEGQKTQFAIGSLPAGSAFAYEVAFTARVSGREAVWRFNTTYSDDFHRSSSRPER